MLHGWRVSFTRPGRDPGVPPAQLRRALVYHPTLFLSLQSGETQSYGRKRYELKPDVALFSAAGHEYTRKGGGCENLVVRVGSWGPYGDLAARGVPVDERT